MILITKQECLYDDVIVHNKEEKYRSSSNTVHTEFETYVQQFPFSSISFFWLFDDWCSALHRHWERKLVAYTSLCFSLKSSPYCYRCLSYFCTNFVTVINNLSLLFGNMQWFILRLSVKPIIDVQIS